MLPFVGLLADNIIHTQKNDVVEKSWRRLFVCPYDMTGTSSNEKLNNLTVLLLHDVINGCSNKVSRVNNNDVPPVHQMNNTIMFYWYVTNTSESYFSMLLNKNIAVKSQDCLIRSSSFYSVSSKFQMKNLMTSELKIFPNNDSKLYCNDLQLLGFQEVSFKSQFRQQIFLVPTGKKKGKETYYKT